MALIYKIVLIDDSSTVRSDLFALGNSAGFEVFAFDNLEDGMDKLRRDPTINGLVLDAECKVSREAKENFNFLNQATIQIEELKSSRGRDIYVIVNTAFPGDADKFFGEVYPINKKDEPRKLFETLQEGIDDLERTYVRRKYSVSIDQLNTIIRDSSKESYLIRLLKNMKREDPETIESNLSDIRKIYEPILRIVFSKENVPSNLSARKKILHLKGQRKDSGGQVTYNESDRILPDYISDICFAIWGLGSSGGHDNDEEIHCTKHTVIGTAHLLLDLINWVHKWLDE